MEWRRLLNGTKSTWRFLPLVLAATVLVVAAAAGPALLVYEIKPGPPFAAGQPRASALADGTTSHAPPLATAEPEAVHPVERPVPVARPAAFAPPAPKPELEPEAAPGSPPEAPPSDPGPDPPLPPARPSPTEPPGPGGASAAGVPDPAPAQAPPPPKPAPPGRPNDNEAGPQDEPARQGQRPDPHSNGRGCDDVLFAAGGPPERGGPAGCQAGNSGEHRRNGEDQGSGRGQADDSVETPDRQRPGKVHGHAKGHDAKEHGPPGGAPEPKGQSKGRSGG